MSRVYEQKFAATPVGEVFEVDLPWVEPRAGKRFEAPVFVLVDRSSYSNAVTTAAIVQDYGFGTVFGEPTADLAATYGAMEHFTLPVTGLPVGFPKAHIIRPNGDPRPQGVVPDIHLPLRDLSSAVEPDVDLGLAAVHRLARAAPWGMAND